MLAIMNNLRSSEAEYGVIRQLRCEVFRALANAERAMGLMISDRSAVWDHFGDCAGVSATEESDPQ
jgi:hypothetical protein